MANYVISFKQVTANLFCNSAQANVVVYDRISGGAAPYYRKAIV